MKKCRYDYVPKNSDKTKNLTIFEFIVYAVFTVNILVLLISIIGAVL